MIACFECGKAIKKGRCVQTVPPQYMVELCGDFPKTFHPACYVKSEERAAKELQKLWPSKVTI